MTHKTAELKQTQQDDTEPRKQQAKRSSVSSVNMLPARAVDQHNRAGATADSTNALSLSSPPGNHRWTTVTPHTAHQVALQQQQQQQQQPATHQADSDPDARLAALYTSDLRVLDERTASRYFDPVSQDFPTNHPREFEGGVYDREMLQGCVDRSYEENRAQLNGAAVHLSER
jgi:hypothetical protein